MTINILDVRFEIRPHIENKENIFCIKVKIFFEESLHDKMG